MKKVLSIAGPDCSGGAGIQADLKNIFSPMAVYGMSNNYFSYGRKHKQRVIDM